MTRLLIGLRSGLFGFDTDGDDAPAQLFRGIQPLSVAIDPVEPALSRRLVEFRSGRSSLC